MPDQYITRYCFGAAYVFVLLHLGLGIGLDERRLAFTNTLPVRWAAGECQLTRRSTHRLCDIADGDGAKTVMRPE